VACLLKARIVKPAEKPPLINNGCVTLKNGVTVGSGVLYAVSADNYVMERNNCWERRFFVRSVPMLFNADQLPLVQKERVLRR
jgi:hypothetical protein